MTSDLLSHWDLMNSFTHWIVCYWWNVSLCSPSVCSCRPPIKKLQVWSVCRRWLISVASQRPTKKRSSWESNCRQSSPTRLNRWNVGRGGGKGAAEGKNEMKMKRVEGVNGREERREWRGKCWGGEIWGESESGEGLRRTSVKMRRRQTQGRRTKKEEMGGEWRLGWRHEYKTYWNKKTHLKYDTCSLKNTTAGGSVG